ncbi:MAG TPA: c-type cytochrome biogenesis protein CcmI [Usitatibacter sp.]|nr:c-type cytochrome biogenesis protein CcmI [Usitatibacter sp.]
MAVFWVLAALMTGVAIAFVVVPLVRSRRPGGPSPMEANLEVLRGQRRELEADIAAGTLSPDMGEQARAELVQRAETDLSAPDTAAPADARRPWATIISAAFAIPALAFGVYLAIGSPAATQPRIAAAGAMDPGNVSALVDSLAQKVRDRPDDAQGWALLARSTASLGRYEESARAYAHLVKLMPADAEVLADYADVLGMSQGQSLAGRPAELVKSALELDPNNRKALALAATAAMEQGRLPDSIGYWERLAALLPAGSDDEREVREVLVELRRRVGAPPRPSLAAAPGAPRTAAKSVSGLVTASPAVASKIASTDTIFVFARAEGGPRAPLAVLRGTARDLPLRFALDDTMAMSPQWSLSRAGDVRIEARVSKSGNASPQPGDVFGSSGVVQPGAKDVRIVLDKVLP